VSRWRASEKLNQRELTCLDFLIHEYNGERPHSSLGYHTPNEVAETVRSSVPTVPSALGKYPRVKQALVHTGQHYDVNIRNWQSPRQNVNMSVAAGSHASPSAEIPVLLPKERQSMLGYAQILLSRANV